MSHPNPQHDKNTERVEDSKFAPRKAHHKKMSPTAHNAPEFKELRKIFAGINSTPSKALEKSKRRMAEKMAKHKK